jgi:hypothetical protein
MSVRKIVLILLFLEVEIITSFNFQLYIVDMLMDSNKASHCK